VPGTKITDHQVRKYKEERKRATQGIAAAKTGISVRSARRIEKTSGLPSQHGERSWRTRTDPLAGVWEEEVIPLLESEPGLLGTTLFEELQRRHPERFEPGVVRTLQRRVRAWRAISGGERETYLPKPTHRDALPSPTSPSPTS
jgi:hypothetical protein